MKLRAIGSGNVFCRWPLIPSCWLLQTHDSNVLIGCPPQAPARLELLNIPLESIDMVVPLDHTVAQIGGLEELGLLFKERKDKPYLVTTEALWGKIKQKIDHPKSFQVKVAKQIGIREEHFTETLSFVDNFSGSYGFKLDIARVFCSGSADVNEDWLYKHMDYDIILHDDRPELAELPVYIQTKLWIYGYTKQADGLDPLPMLYMPQGSCVYDSDRRDKVMVKERYIRENSKRLLGNEKS